MNKKKTKPLFTLILISLVILILYYLFRDSYREILEQIRQAKKPFLFLLLLLGNCYVLLDGVAYFHMLKKNGELCSIGDAIKMAYLGIFFGVSTMGSGTKPGQIYYLYQRNVNPGKSFGLLTLSYVLHKLAIMLYACLMLLFYHGFIQDIYETGSLYIYGGFAFSTVIILVLILVCISERFHRMILRPFEKWLKRPAWKEKLSYAREQLYHLRMVSIAALQHKKELAILILIYAIKMTCWYLLPALSYAALSNDKLSCSFLQLIAAAAIMQLLIGVVPSANGLGSTEIVYLLIFGHIFGKVTAASTLILYRVANYYFPFLISIIVTAKCRKKKT